MRHDADRAIGAAHEVHCLMGLQERRFAVALALLEPLALLHAVRDGLFQQPRGPHQPDAALAESLHDSRGGVELRERPNRRGVRPRELTLLVECTSCRVQRIFRREGRRGRVLQFACPRLCDASLLGCRASLELFLGVLPPQRLGRRRAFLSALT